MKDFLGPLPKHYVAVGRFDSNSKKYWRGFINRQTGVAQTEDPRTGTLPEDWIRKIHPSGQGQHLFSNQVTGEETFNDPSLGVEELRKRGVSLETFGLI